MALSRSTQCLTLILSSWIKKPLPPGRGFFSYAILSASGHLAIGRQGCREQGERQWRSSSGSGPRRQSERPAPQRRLRPSRRQARRLNRTLCRFFQELAPVRRRPLQKSSTSEPSQSMRARHRREPGRQMAAQSPAAPSITANRG